MKDTSLEHHLLIAMPSLTGDCFDHAIVYIYQHSDEGAMGVIVNKPMQISVADILEHLAIDNFNEPLVNQQVLMGGPIDQGQGFILHNDKEELVLSSSKDLLEQIANNETTAPYLITLGYSGWNNGQLEEEIKNNCWLVIPYDSDILFNTPIEERWQKAISVLGIDIHQISDLSGHA